MEKKNNLEKKHTAIKQKKFGLANENFLLKYFTEKLISFKGLSNDLQRLFHVQDQKNAFNYFFPLNEKISVERYLEFISKLLAWIGNEYFHNQNSLYHLDFCCRLVEKTIYDNMDVFTEKNHMPFLFYTSLIEAKTNQAIGYWTSKKKNPGGKAMKDIGEKNTEIIKKIMKDLKITDTSIFRQDKKTRETFYSKAKEQTKLTEGRIYRKTRPFVVKS